MTKASLPKYKIMLFYATKLVTIRVVIGNLIKKDYAIIHNSALLAQRSKLKNKSKILKYTKIHIHKQIKYR